MAAESEPPPSHVIATVRTDNGELTEDVVSHDQAEGDDDRVVDHTPLPDTPERPHPEAPVPGSLPRHDADG
jgi:hypothetical protein